MDRGNGVSDSWMKMEFLVELSRWSAESWERWKGKDGAPATDVRHFLCNRLSWQISHFGDRLKSVVDRVIVGGLTAQLWENWKSICDEREREAPTKYVGHFIWSQHILTMRFWGQVRSNKLTAPCSFASDKKGMKGKWRDVGDFHSVQLSAASDRPINSPPRWDPSPDWAVQ